MQGAGNQVWWRKRTASGARQRDFALKSQVIELFAFFDKFKDGTIDVLEIKHGLPFRMFAEVHA